MVRAEGGAQAADATGSCARGAAREKQLASLQSGNTGGMLWGTDGAQGVRAGVFRVSSCRIFHMESLRFVEQ
jgi:hypothetical protein